MNTTAHKSMHFTAVALSSAVLALMITSGTPTGASAGEVEAKTILKGMSDYLAAQKAISFKYDTNLEVVTKEHQKLLLASSGKMEVGRPDKISSNPFRRVCQCRDDI